MIPSDLRNFYHQYTMSSLLVSEIFDSIQGETSFAGIPTTFIRLCGCPLRCSWCDSAFAYHEGSLMSIEQILHAVQLCGLRTICVTGGEPLAQPNTIELITILLAHDYQVSVETGGSCAINNLPKEIYTILDIKCPSSGMHHRNVWDNLPLLKTDDEVKFVIGDREDYEWAKEVINHYQLTTKVRWILMGVVWGMLDPAQLISWIQADRLPVRFNPQLHKWIWPAATRGV